MHRSDPAISTADAPSSPAHAGAADPDGPLATGTTRPPSTADDLTAPRHPAHWLLVRAALAAAVTAFAINHSYLHGPLVLRPGPDDVNYFVDGLRRLDEFFGGGIGGLLRSLAHYPPHAPFSALLAAASFAVFGRHDWAPYAGNVIIVFALLCFVDWCLGPARPWQRLLAYAMLLCSRLPYTAVEQFRPDFAWGVCTAFAVVFGLSRPLAGPAPLAGAALRRRLAVGALFGLSLLLKPSTCVLTTALLGFTLVLNLAVYRDWVGRGALGKLCRALLPALLAAVVVAVPYYAVAWRETYEYIYANVAGSQKQFWAYHGSKLDQLRYYLDGFGGNAVVGGWHVYLWALTAAAGAAVAVYRRGTKAIPPILAGLLAGAVAYLAPTSVVSKNPYFGATFYTLLLAGAVLGLRQLLAASRQAGRAAPLAAYVAACAASVALFAPPYASGDRYEAREVVSRRLVRDIYDAINARSAQPRVFIPMSGMSVSTDTLQYMAVLDHRPWRFESLPLPQWDDHALLERNLDDADFVVAGDPGNDEVLAYLPGSTALGYYLERIRARDAFVEIARYPTSNGRLYHLFERKDLPFAGWAPVFGMGDAEGPYPQWGLPLIRWATFPGSGIQPTDERGGNKTLVLDCLSHTPNQKMTVLLDGVPIGTHAFPAKPRWTRFDHVELPLSLPPGAHQVEFQYDHPNGPQEPAAVLFKTIRINP